MYKRNSYKLLSEQYDVMLLKESAPSLNIYELQSKIGYMNLSEATWTAEFSEKILNEFFGGGVKALGKGIGGAIGGAAKKAGGKLRQAGADKAADLAGKAKAGAQAGMDKLQAGADAVKGKVQDGADAVRDGIDNVKDRAGNMMDDVKDVYQQGGHEAQLQKAQQRAEKTVGDLMSILQMAEQEYGLAFSGPVEQLPLGEVVSELVNAAKGAGNIKRSAQRKLGKFGAR